MILDFKLPDLGEGVAEGEIVKWLVAEGQQVKEDEPMVEVMTDKATVQIPSPTSGVVKQILAKEGQTVKVGTNLVVLESSKGDGQKSGAASSEQIQQPKAESLTQGQSNVSPERSEGLTTSKMAQQQEASKQPRQVIATPATRKLARDLGVELETISGSGPAGRITDQDVRNAVSAPKMAPKQMQPQEKAVQQQVQQALERPKAVSSDTQALQTETTSGAREERIAIHGIRKRISEKMIKSAQGTASVTHVDEVDFTELVNLREASKPLAESKKVKLTYLPFIIKAVIATLKQFQYFNASIDDEKKEIIMKRYYNIGIAADTPNGLIVPVVRDADKKNVIEIASEIERLSEAARNGTIQLHDLQGGTFTITNIGTLGGIMSTPIINIPEVAILGVHKIQKKPVVKNDQIVIRDMGYVALTFDHRIVDGADAARFTSKLKQYLESPALIFLAEVS